MVERDGTCDGGGESQSETEKFVRSYFELHSLWLDVDEIENCLKEY